MFGWNEITSDPESDLFLSDPVATDAESTTLLELGASLDAAIRWSYIFDDGISLVQEFPPSIDGHSYSGWMLVA